jgi:hypothetical protein
MDKPNLLEESEKFRSSVMFAIGNLQVSESEKKVFILNFQHLYLEILTQLLNSSQLMPTSSPEEN